MTARARVALRPPSFVMRLSCLGAFHQTRLSFMRSLLRRLRAEKWRFFAPAVRPRCARSRARRVSRPKRRRARFFACRVRARFARRASLRPRHRNRLGRRLRAFRRRSDDGGFRPPRPPRAAPRGGTIHRARVGVVARESKRALVFALRRSLGGGVCSRNDGFCSKSAILCARPRFTATANSAWPTATSLARASARGRRFKPNCSRCGSRARSPSIGSSIWRVRAIQTPPLFRPPTAARWGSEIRPGLAWRLF